ncbi:MAG: hypothetical protein KDK72_01550 [Chlamydiia bacterium]|nr:hypothetical protein [Chlamydiia bacterium]
MSIVDISQALVTPYNYPLQFRDAAEGVSGAKVHIALNVLGYLPVIGTIVGIARIALTLYLIISKGSDLELRRITFHSSEIVRGLVEVTSCGILLIIPDFWVSMGQLIADRVDCQRYTRI